MKKRILILCLLCAAFLLSGCGEAAPAPTPTPEPTAVPTPEPTPEPTPTPNYFEVNDITLWEYCTPELKYSQYYNETVEKELGLLPFNYISAVYSSDGMYSDCVYAFPEDRSEFFAEQVDTETELFLAEIPSANFIADYEGSNFFRFYINRFFQPYQEHIEPEITLEEWAEKFKDYKLICSQILSVLHSEDFFPTLDAHGLDSSRRWYDRTWTSCIIDRESGNVLTPLSVTYEPVSFTVNCNGEDVECWAVHVGGPLYHDDIAKSRLEKEIYKDRRITFLEQICVLVPADYEGILLGRWDMDEPLMDKDEFFAEFDAPEEEDTAESGWWCGSMYEYLEDKENGRFHYWGMMKPEPRVLFSNETVDVILQEPRTLTVTLKGLDLKDSYTVNHADAEKMYAEYLWEVSMDAGEQRLSVGTMFWTDDPGAEYTATLDGLIDQIFYGWYQILVKDEETQQPVSLEPEVSHTEDSITWHVTLPPYGLSTDIYDSDAPMDEYGVPDLTDFDVSPYRYPIDMDFSAIDTIEVKVNEFDGEKYVLEFDVTP